MSTNQNHTTEEEVLKNHDAEVAQENTENLSGNENVDTAETENLSGEENTENTENIELTPEETLAKELEETKAELENYKDKYLRLSAEFDNYRKRTMKEKAELIKNGGEKAITSVLPIIDDLERALQNMQKSDDIKAMYDGVELIYQKFIKNLNQEGLVKMEPIGETFDTDFHEAIALVPSPEEAQKGKVLDCVQTGYKLNDKVIRHAKVVVAQ